MDFDQNKKLIVAVSVVAVTVAIGFVSLWFKKRSLQQKIALNPLKKSPFKLIEKEEVSHDTRRFRFSLQSPDHVLGLPTGQHMYLSARIGDKLVIRPYTPVTSNDEVGYFDLIIKVYFKDVHPKFPNGGKMTQYLDELSIGQCIDVRGPVGHLTYLENGQFKIAEGKTTKVLQCKNVGMIAGGTGITPMLQIIRAILKDEDDHTKMFLLFANQSEEDILLRKEIEGIQSEHPERFSFWYTLDRPKDDWSYSSGFINEEMISNHLPKATDDSLILMCGPPPMITYACIPNLKKLGFSEDQFYSF